MEAINEVEKSFVDIIEEIESLLYIYKDCLNNNDNEEDIIDKGKKIYEMISSTGEKLTSTISSLPLSKTEKLNPSTKKEFFMKERFEMTKELINNLDKKLENSQFE